MNLEKTWYEASPYLYGVIGIIALILADSKIAYICAAMLLSSALTIVTLRQHYRKAERESVRG